MGERYGEIKRTWHGASARERHEDIDALTALMGEAQASTESGSEALEMEIEDLIQDIHSHS